MVLVFLLAATIGHAVPEIEIDTTEAIVTVPQGTVVTQSLNILNNGDATLNWTLNDRVEGQVVKDFASPWTSATSLRYDTTRNCLWLAYYYSSDIKKVSTSNGSVLTTKNMGSACTRPYGMEIENGFLWATDYVNTRFVKLNLDNMSVAGQTPFPSGWSYAYGMAIGGGNWYATSSGDYNDIYRLNPSTGAIQSTYDEVEYFYYYYNHISYGDNGIWYGAYYTPKNELRKFDPAKGRIRRTVTMPDWDSAQIRIKDQAFVSNDRQVWVLTYRHDYNVSGQSKYWIHLLDVGALSWFSQSADRGSVPPTDSRDINVVFDGTTAPIGIHHAGVALDSNGGSTQEKPFLFVVHVPGANGAPTAHAGQDRTLDATAPVMSVTLDGSGSMDPDGDELVYEWAMGDGSTADGVGPSVDLAPGVHDITLTVRDLRGGVDSDTVRITIRAPDIEVDDCYVLIPEGSGTGTGTVTIRNSGDRTLNWSVSEAVQLDQSSIIREFVINWVSSYSTYAYPYTMSYDATRDCLWVGYYYDDEVGKINASNGSTITTKALGGSHRVYALDMEGADLWIADRSAKKFQKFNIDTVANTQTINNPWGTGYGPTSLARDSGEFYASQYYAYDICKLDAASGAVQKTHPVGERQYYYNHHDAINGKVWYTRYNTPKTRIHCMDGASGNLLTTLDMGHWNSAGQIYDLSFVNSTQCWMLTYNVKGDSKRYGHLVDLSAGARFSKTATSGSVAAGGTGTFNVSYDATGLPLGRYTVTLTFASNDPDEPTYEKDVVFVVHEDAPNTPPNANAGPDRSERIEGISAAFVLDLTGAGSSDPDGDPLLMTWTWTDSGDPVVVTDKGLVELGIGTHRLTLTVGDYRGGVDTDETVITVTKRPLEGWPCYGGPSRTYVSPEKGWLQNWPPIERWRTNVGGSHGCPLYKDGLIYTEKGGARCLDAETGKILWTTKIPGKAPQSHSAVDDQYLFTYSRHGEASCFNRFTGKMIWSRDTRALGNTREEAGGKGQGASPLVEGDIVIFQSLAMNKHTGDVFWKGRDNEHCCTWGLDREGRRWFVQSGYMTDILTGRSSISLGSMTGRGHMTPVPYGPDKVFDVRGVRAIGASSDDWYDSAGNYCVQYALPAVAGDYAYIPDSHSYGGAGGKLKCVRLTDGKLMWTGGGCNASTAADGKLIVDGGGIEVLKLGPDGYDREGREYHIIEGLSCGGYGNPPYPVGTRLYTDAGKWIVCLDTGLSAPVVNNGSGAIWDPRTASALLTGGLNNTGGVPCQAWIYWGSSDGGTNAGMWEHAEALGPMGRGPFSATVSGLSSNTAYYYRCYGANSIGGTWAPATERFETGLSRAWQDDALFVHWPLDEGTGARATDLSGNGNHGTVSRENFWRDGILGKCLWLGGNSSDDHVLCSQLSRVIYHDVSVSVWINCTEAGASGNTVCRLLRLSYGSEDSRGLDIRMDGRGERVVGFGLTSAGAVNNGKWHHIACVRAGNKVRLYMNGVLESEKAAGRICMLNRFELRVHGSNPHKGFFDDVRVYRRALNSREVSALHAMGAAGTAAMEGCRAGAGSDDAEELDDGTVVTDCTALTLGSNSVVGIRFDNVGIPRGATVLDAAIQFHSGGSNLSTRAIVTDGGLVGYANEDQGGTATIGDCGRTIRLDGNTWKAHPITPYQVTSKTILEFDFSSSKLCEIHALGLDTDPTTKTESRIFSLHGKWGNRTYNNYRYKPLGSTAHYRIPVGQHYTGTMSWVVFVNDDDDAPQDGVSVFSNVVLYESDQPQNKTSHLLIRAEATDSSATFSAAPDNISSRPATTASVLWRVPTWTGGTAPSDVSRERTPDLSAAVQEVVDRDGWAISNSLAFLIEGGQEQGARIAASGEAAGDIGPALHVLWTDAVDADGDSLPDVWERKCAIDPAWCLAASVKSSMKTDETGNGRR